MNKITTIMIISHYNCNFHCDYCNQREFNLSELQQLDYYDVFNFINWLYQTKKLANKINIQFEGGETLIRWKNFIKPLVNLLNKLQLTIQYSLFTNGTILTEELYQFLYDNNFIITLSIDGDKKVFSSQRNDKFFPIVYKNMQKFLSLPNKIRINAVFTPNTINYLYDSYLFFKKNQVREINFSPDNRISTKWTSEQLKKITEEFIKILEEDKNYNLVIPQNMLWNSKNSALNKKICHNRQLRIFPNKKISFNSDPFLKNEQKTENCTLDNYQTNFKIIDTNIEQQDFVLNNLPEICEKCISRFICPPSKNISSQIQTSPALCAMRVAFLIEEKLENG